MRIADMTTVQIPTPRGTGASVRAVGWLGRGEPFSHGMITLEQYRRLGELARDPFQPYVSAGIHRCELCQFDGEACSSTELFIPGDGFLFWTPTMICHYINAHHYKPPEEFLKAAARCPDTH